MAEKAMKSLREEADKLLKKTNERKLIDYLTY